MNWLAALYAIIKLLPDIINLIKEIDKKNKELKLDRKVADDIKDISKSFGARDAEALKKIFMS